MSKQECVMKKTSIGGQALIEGVMMRGPERTAMAVRHISGEIRTEEWDNPKKKPFFMKKWPLIRGLFGMISSLTIGYKCLMRSAEMSGLEEELEEAMKKEETPVEEQTAEEVSTQEEAVEESIAEEVPAEENNEAPAEEIPAKPEEKKSSKLMTVIMIVGVVLGVALSVGLFIFLPTQLFDWIFPGADNRYLKSIFEGVMRITIFLGYMVLVSRMKDIRRTFMYHGAEHKSIFCYEKGLPLTVENVRKQKRFHPRCGTSFLILMLVVGIFIGLLIPHSLPALHRTIIKILMLPLTVGIGYELIKLAGRFDNWFTRIISAPGMWMQRLTTIEPDDEMIECAITALEAVIPEDPEADKW